MSVVNDVLDRAMRRIVAVRMRPQTLYSFTNTAVILVAPQQDLLAAEEATNVARLLRMARAAHLTVIYAPLADPAGTWTVRTPSKQALTDRGALRAGSPGADIHPALTPNDGEHVLQPFDGLSAFTNPALVATLTERNLHHVVIAGARTDIEVDSTARDATEAGLHTTVVGDCCTGSNPHGHHATVITTLPRLVHAVVTLADLPALIR